MGFVRIIRQRLTDERGMTLIEVMMSAALVVTIAGAVLGSVNGAEKTSGQTAAEAVGGNLAQQDQERLRGLRVAQLGNLYQNSTIRVRGVNYNVESSGTYVSDSTQTAGCTSTSTANYIRITSSVSAPILKNPVDISSLVNPGVGTLGDNNGGLVVQITDRNGAGVANIPVTISGPGHYTQETSAQGCAFFAYVPIGAYTMTYDQPGWVDKTGTEAVSLTGTVLTNQIASYQTTYDQAATINATFETRIPGNAQLPSSSESITLTNSGFPGGTGSKLVAPTSPPAASITADHLFPYTSNVGIFSGDCAKNALPAGLISQLPAGRYTTSQLLAPGGVYNARVFEPAILLAVKANGNAIGGANVTLTQAGTGCTGKRKQVTTSSGALTDPGLPYGTWNICADAVIGGQQYMGTTNGVVNDQLDGRSANLAMTSGSGPCP
jgi:type II secretory pathway pseudopilin PulG